MGDRISKPNFRYPVRSASLRRADRPRCAAVPTCSARVSRERMVADEASYGPCWEPLQTFRGASFLTVLALTVWFDWRLASGVYGVIWGA
jgi:hypothetical protein